MGEAIDLTKKPLGTTLATLRKNGWDHGVQNIVRIKHQIENAESFKTRTYQTMEGSQTDIEWE